MKASELAILLFSFVRTRWGLHFRSRAALESWQAKRLNTFLRNTITHASFYRNYSGQPLASLPIVDKSITLAQFSAFNARSIALEDAIAAALAAEHGNDVPAGFDPTLTAGLSSGTQGPRGVFLANARERASWAGILLARTLDRASLTDLLMRRAPLRVAFFLRANSALYMTLKSRKIDFRFFDLQSGAHTHIHALAQFSPDVLVAPASILAWLASESIAGRLPITPRRTISVAEVLEPTDQAQITLAWDSNVHQLYQCTEGFLAYTCELGTLHLNEEFVHFEPEWLDASHTRFTPIITDFTRRTQMIVRYRLSDILRLREGPCGCGRFTTTLKTIDGRLDDVLWLRDKSDTRGLKPLFPDIVRHTITRQQVIIQDYRIEQHGQALHLAIDGDDTHYATLTCAIDRLIEDQNMQPVRWRRVSMPVVSPTAKRRRIVCREKPPLIDVVTTLSPKAP